MSLYNWRPKKVDIFFKICMAPSKVQFGLQKLFYILRRRVIPTQYIKVYKWAYLVTLPKLFLRGFYSDLSQLFCCHAKAGWKGHPHGRNQLITQKGGNSHGLHPGSFTIIAGFFLDILKKKTQGGSGTTSSNFSQKLKQFCKKTLKNLPTENQLFS